MSKSNKLMRKELEKTADIFMKTYRIGLDNAVEEALKLFKGDLDDVKNGLEVMREFTKCVVKEATLQKEMASFGIGGFKHE